MSDFDQRYTDARAPERQRLIGTRAPRRIGVLHIGKTGGTALKTVLTAHRERHPDAPFETFSHAMTLPRLWNRHPEANAVFFVRDPIERYVSGFNSRKRQGRPRHDFPWSDVEAEAFAAFATANELAEGLSDRAFAAGRAMQAIQHVRAPLSAFLISVEFLEANRDSILFVGRCKNFDSDLAALRDVLNIDPDIEQPRDDIGAHRSLDSDEKNLSAVAIENLTAYFEKDYRILRWCEAWQAV